MALNWDIVRAEHVREACDLVASGQHAPRTTAKGLFVSHDGRELPAKHVLRLAYLLAHRLSPDSELRFASGEGTLSRLRALGFVVTRANRA